MSPTIAETIWAKTTAKTSLRDWIRSPVRVCRMYRRRSIVHYIWHGSGGKCPQLSRKLHTYLATELAKTSYGVTVSDELAKQQCYSGSWCIFRQKNYANSDASCSPWCSPIVPMGTEAATFICGSSFVRALRIQPHFDHLWRSNAKTAPAHDNAVSHPATTPFRAENEVPCGPTHWFVTISPAF